MNDPSPTLADVQELIRKMYGWKDHRRGAEATFLWFSEEVGELAAALRESDDDALEKEFADVLAWLATLANVRGIDLGRAIRRKYGEGCPGCGQFVCDCGPSVKP
jgi:NTP pyrophosphatase (non-canonical NTP hydrolase)